MTTKASRSTRWPSRSTRKTPRRSRSACKAGNKFSNGEPVDAKSFVDAWNYGALVTNAQQNSSFFAPIEGYAAVHPEAAGAKPTARR